MLDACIEIQEFTKDISRSKFTENRMLVLAVLKDLELVGEAASRIDQKFRALHSQIPWKAIVSMRNRLIHSYFDINLDIVWQTVVNEVPQLRRLLHELITKN